MKKMIFSIFLILLTFNLFCNESYPDFNRIVQTQHQIRERELEFYKGVYDQLQGSGREMDNYDVRYYRIDIELDFDEEYIAASVLMGIDILEDNTQAVQVHFADFLNVDEIIMSSQSLSFLHENGLIEIDLAGNYNNGDYLEIETFYFGNPDVRLEDGIKFEEHAGVPVVFSMVSPRGARKWWPCKDTPADKPDSLDIWLTYPSQYICASNGILQEEINNGNGTKTSKWHESYPIATYLTSFAITNYQMYSFLWEYDSYQMMVDNYIYPEQTTASTALYSLSGDMLTFLSNTYGIFPFVSEKYGHATCTNLGALAMEHQTCTSFDAAYISNPAAEYTVVHELGHSWAGNSLSIGSWSHVWLKEGFASYSEALWAENLYGSQGLQDYMQAEDTGSVLNECLYRDESLGANHIFNSVVYNKGSWTVHMLRGVLGEDDFFDFLPFYFQNPDLIYGNVLTEDLKNCAEAVAGYDLDWFFDQWFYHYGRPLYDFCYYTSNEEDSLKISLRSMGSQGDPFSMFVPFRLNGEDQRIWAADGLNHATLFLEEEVITFDWDPDNWVLDGGYTEKIPVLDDISVNRDGSVVLTWSAFFDPEIAGFNVYRRLAGEDYLQINASPVSNTYFYDDDVSAGVQYFYKIAAVFQSEGNYISKFSNEISLIPVDFTFEEGILVVDGTLDFPAGSPFPTDEEIDLFYNAILGSYAHVNWDVAADGLPPLPELARYSTLIWHTDDPVNVPFQNNLYNIKSYLLAGGNLLISSWKMLYYLQDNFKEYYLNLSNASTNENPDFIGASGLNGFPDFTIDIDKIPMSIWNNTLKNVNKFDPIDNADPIYLYDSETNDPNWENAVCAQRFYDNFKVYVLGFPLYYIEQNAAAQIIDIILQDFGEETSAGENPIPSKTVWLNNYPNPFNPSTTISFNFSSEQNEPYVLSVYNLKGQKVKILPVSSSRGPTVSVVWDGTNSIGKACPSGVYFYRLASGNEELAANKMLLLR